MVVGVVPAAGTATRLRPAGSKEVIAVGGRPVMDYLVERLRAARCDAIRVVTRPQKRDVVAHAQALGATVVAGTPANVCESLALAIGDLAEDDRVLFGFPDTIWEPFDAFPRLLEVAADVVLGLFRCADLERSDVVVVDRDVVREIHVKPTSPPSALIWGCAAARRSALDGLHRYAEAGQLFGELARDGRVRGVDFGTEFLDIGTPEALERARARFG
jgi:NDP-sugar pyrophosphorylase family protein